ncbi:MAG: Hsp70 family protein [bacterium]|nr:Hsp70 family protein [bacterium]
MSIEEHRFVIGIDLGTTNCAVSYVDIEAHQSAGEGIRIFKIPQLTGPGQVNSLPLLPSFLYIPGEYDITEDSIVRLWDGREENIVGAFARDQGALVPDRLVSSAKSWLCHSNVDRRARILPWGTTGQISKISPVAATAAYLKHIRLAWNAAWGPDQNLQLENQLVVITVPASFDEIARDLTLEATKSAGINTAVLLEEPLAAFYSWLMLHEKNWRDLIQPGELILICDVGGGTTDFTLIILKDSDGSPRFERIAVGEHLILGGDNIDLALARRIEAQLTGPRRAMSTDRWKALCHQCRQAKETILGGSAKTSTITLMGEGGRVIAGTQQVELTDDAIAKTVLEGFFPITAGKPLSSAAGRKGITEFGLPYEPEPAITKHIKGFIDQHWDEVQNTLQRPSAAPDWILFNGGSLKPSVIRQRIRAAMQQWYHEPDSDGPRVLENHDLDLAVTFGAAYYGLVKIGRGVRVGSGSPRSYYLGVARTETDQAETQSREVMCLVERGLDEGSTIHLKNKSFELLANQPVAFDIFSSSYRSGDRQGDLVEVNDSLTELPPLQTVIQYGKKGIQRTLPVLIEAEYTEVGTLAIWCRSRISEHRWKLQFQLRNSIESIMPATDAQVLELSVVEAARRYLRQVLTGGNKSDVQNLIKQLSRTVELPRDDWPLGFIRSLADELLDLVATRSKGMNFESGWMNLLGFCLRPGIGDGLDKQRMQRLWKLYKSGPVLSGNSRVRLEWWIMWRRVAAGLTHGQQHQIFQSLSTMLISSKKSAIKVTPQERLEIWMFAANLEKIYSQEKIRLGRQLFAEISLKKPKAQHLWALSRLAARDLLYGSADRTIPPSEANKWIELLMGFIGSNPKPIGRTISQMARKTGDRARDINEETRARVLTWMETQNLADDMKHRVREILPLAPKDQNAIFGESLPQGIILKLAKGQ